MDEYLGKALEVASNVKDKISSVASNNGLTVESVLRVAVKTPGVKIDRESFLRKELKNRFPIHQVDCAVENNPAYAGIGLDVIDALAKHAINYETNKVSTASFVMGLPGGIAMAATIPADLAQYFGFILRIMQKLAYLYGFQSFNLQEDDINEETLNQIMVFLGVMYGVQGANGAVKALSGLVSSKIAKTLPQKALTKGAVYPIVKKVASMVGMRMTKQIFANGISKAVPVIGGLVAGGLTYGSFKPCSVKLKNTFRALPLCDPEYYRQQTDDSE